MKREEAIRALKDMFENDEDLFVETIEDLDSYNGFLGDDRIYEMELLDECYSETEPLEILRRAFFGYDGDTSDASYTDSRHFEPFNPNRDYFYWNAYGNLVSTDYKDYSYKLDDDFIEEVIDNINRLWIRDNDEVMDIINKIGA